MLGTIVLLGGCNVFGGTDGTVPPDADAGSNAAEPPDLPPDAPPTISGGAPKEDELTEKYGLFVSLIGTPEGEGTREHPLSSITQAIEKAKASAKRVYVCKGTYNEAVVLANAVSVIGGYECATKWAPTEGGRSKIVAPTIPALRASDIVNDTSFINFDVVAPNATAESPSSIGFIAQNAKLLRIVTSSITAGDGIRGEAGVEPPDQTLPSTAMGRDGIASVDRNGGYSVRSFTVGTTTKWRVSGAGGGSATCGGITLDPGGTGGDGGRYQCKEVLLANGQYRRNWAIYNDLAPSAGAVKANSGATGAVGADGASASAIGQLGATGYVAADGAVGGNGGSGVGGSGGDGELTFQDPTTCLDTKVGLYGNGATGSGGGAGGCPGFAGTAGKGGTASIAVLMLASEGLTFDAALLQAGTGGAGGKGTLGSAPTAGGQPGEAYAGAKAGEAGGNGGRPGVSGSGAGGPSLGIAHSGGVPTLTNGAVAKAGRGGDGVPADSKTVLGVTWTLPASAPGVTEALHAF